jgi:hypothetical protein
LPLFHLSGSFKFLFISWKLLAVRSLIMRSCSWHLFSFNLNFSISVTIFFTSFFSSSSSSFYAEKEKSFPLSIFTREQKISQLSLTERRKGKQSWENFTFLLSYFLSLQPRKPWWKFYVQNIIIFCGNWKKYKFICCQENNNNILFYFLLFAFTLPFFHNFLPTFSWENKI